MIYHWLAREKEKRLFFWHLVTDVMPSYSWKCTNMTRSRIIKNSKMFLPWIILLAKNVCIPYFSMLPLETKGSSRDWGKMINVWSTWMKVCFHHLMTVHARTTEIKSWHVWSVICQHGIWKQGGYRHSHQLNFAFSLLQSAFFATNFSLKKRDPNLELFWLENEGVTTRGHENFLGTFVATITKPPPPEV